MGNRKRAGEDMNDFEKDKMGRGYYIENGKIHFFSNYLEGIDEEKTVEECCEQLNNYLKVNDGINEINTYLSKENARLKRAIKVLTNLPRIGDKIWVRSCGSIWKTTVENIAIWADDQIMINISGGDGGYMLGYEAFETKGEAVAVERHTNKI